MVGSRWSDDELEFLKQNYDSMSDEKMASKLNRTKASVGQKRRGLDLYRRDKSKR